MYDEFIGDDETLQDNWDNICQICDDLQSAGACIPGNPHHGEVQTLLFRCPDESAIEHFLRHMYVKRIEELKRWVKLKLSKMQSIEENQHSFILVANDVTEDRIEVTNVGRLVNENLSETKQSLVIDLEFLKMMPIDVRHYLSLTILTKTLSQNKTGAVPYELFLTNLGNIEDYHAIRNLFKITDTPEKCDTDDTWTFKCYTDLFPKEKLVLISPLSENELVYDYDDTYIISALHENFEYEGNLALEKAKQEGIRHAKLPTKETRGMRVFTTLLDYKGWNMSYI